MHVLRFCLLRLLIAIHSLGPQALAQVDLGTAAPFAIIASTAITNTGSITLEGQVGIYPNGATSITGFPLDILGAVSAGDDVAKLARQDAQTAYNVAASLNPTVQMMQSLNGQTLVPGTYTTSSSLHITGGLELDGQNDPDAVFVFQVGTTLTTALASHIILTNSTRACNVFWQVGSSATLGIGSSFKGNILALTSISLKVGVNVAGALYALNGNITIDEDSIAVQRGCTIQPPVTSSPISVTSSTLLSPVAITPETLTFTSSPTFSTSSPTLSTSSPPLSTSSTPFSKFSSTFFYRPRPSSSKCTEPHPKLSPKPWYFPSKLWSPTVKSWNPYHKPQNFDQTLGRSSPINGGHHGGQGRGHGGGQDEGHGEGHEE